MIGASWMSGQSSDFHASHSARPANAAATTATAMRERSAAKVRFDHALVGLADPRRPFGDLLAGIEHERRLAEAHPDLHVVLDEQHRLAAVAQAAHGIEQLVE